MMRLQVDAVAIRHVGEAVARADGVQHAVAGWNDQVLADEQQVRVLDVVGPQHGFGAEVVLLGDLPQDLALGDGVVDQRGARGWLRRRLGDAREGRGLRRCSRA